MSQGKYMYCLIESPDSLPAESLEQGGIDSLYPRLSLVCFQDLACVVSESSLKEYPVSRDYSMAHQNAIERIMKTHAVLPIAFSTVAESEIAIIEKVLQPRYEEFKNLLVWVSDKVEKGLKVYWKELSKVFESILVEDPAIRSFKETLASKPAAATYYDRIDLGKEVQAAFEAKKDQEKMRLLNRLKHCAADVKLTPTYGDGMVLNAAFFVEKVKAIEFDEIVEEMRVSSNGNLQLRYFGPVPPFNFVTVRIRWD